jgi:hypothetical protein
MDDSNSQIDDDLNPVEHDIEDTFTLTPFVGAIVLYKLTTDDAEKINRCRTTGASILERMDRQAWPTGAQAHIGTDVKAGDEFPMVIVKVHTGELVNGQVLLDGTDNYWVQQVASSWKSENGKWSWIRDQEQSIGGDGD